MRNDGYLICIFFLFTAIFCFAQNIKTEISDSLSFILLSAKQDTSSVNKLNELSRDLYFKGDYDNALRCAEKAKTIAEKLYFKEGLITSFYNISNIYLSKSNYPEALKYAFKSLQIVEKINDSTKAAVLNLIGVIYEKQKELSNALQYHSKALKIREAIKDEKGIAQSNNNIGNIFRHKGEHDQALKYYQKSLEIRERIEDKRGTINTLSNIVNIYYDKEMFFEAIEWQKKALKICDEIGDVHGKANSMISIGSSYKELKKYSEAIYHFNIGLEISKQIGSLEFIAFVEMRLSETYELMNKHENALEHYKNYTQTQNQLFNEENTKKMVQVEMNFEFDKKETLAKAEQEKKDALTNKEKQKQRLILFFVSGFLILSVVFTFFIFRNLQTNKKQKIVIEEKQKEITDNINYAKRLQQAIIPSDNLWKKHLPESFVMYQPKDIVSGDFYWLENVNELVLFASADCTGHGVSGAMVSVVCSNALNRTIKEFGITEPSKILDKTRELVLETFAKSENDIKDGMDISLCSLNTKTNQLLWSGANNPLWYIRENNLNEIKPDKQPIGKTDNPKPFTTHKIELQKGDTLYIFTDGYADQFGGEKQKKFMYKPLKNLLLEIHQQPLTTQKEHLQKHFASWKGTTEQTDDVLIIGVKI